MSTLFANAFGSGWFDGQMKQAAGESVIYARGGQSATVTAWVGRTVFSSNLSDGPRVEFGDRDYLILAADLAAFGEPQIGDRISQTLAGQSQVFEVLPPGTGDPAWRWSDPGHTIYRLHTKRVS